MPANIATTNGRPAFIYYGEAPWQRLGQKLDAPATAEEAIAAAGLDYTISLTDVATVDGMMVPKTKAVVRYDIGGHDIAAKSGRIRHAKLIRWVDAA